ncbi:hypothetical protein [Nostoc sp.]|uniref:hypothetical protein n=1 Tax=Nostoc sp. TaxID=1180 RepID=UPI002FF52B0E
MTYKLISPDNQIVEFENITRFCHEQGLNKGNIYKLLCGTNSTCKGWRLVDKSKPYCIGRKRNGNGFFREY